jgi:HUS1 checkpoint protein
MDMIFENYNIQSAEASNTINLELPLGPLQRALKSALGSTAASLRLTKRDGVPVLSMTIHTTTKDAAPGGPFGGPGNAGGHFPGEADDGAFATEPLEVALRREREKIITQDMPVRVLHPETVETIMQPRVREPDVHIQLPPLLQLKAISDRFTRLAASTASRSSPKLELSANMYGSLRLRIATDALDITSVWDNLENPELDPAQIAGPLSEHPSTIFRAAGPDRWATVRVDGRDWSRVLGVGRLEGRVIACFADDHALILYVYVPHYDDSSAEDSVVTVRSLFFSSVPCPLDPQSYVNSFHSTTSPAIVPDDMIDTHETLASTSGFAFLLF